MRGSDGCRNEYRERRAAGMSCRRAVLSDQILHQQSGDHIRPSSAQHLCPQLAPHQAASCAGKVYNAPAHSTRWRHWQSTGTGCMARCRDWLEDWQRQCKEETVLVLSGLSEPVMVAYIPLPFCFRWPVCGEGPMRIGVVTRPASAGRLGGVTEDATLRHGGEASETGLRGGQCCTLGIGLIIPKSSKKCS